MRRRELVLAAAGAAVLARPALAAAQAEREADVLDRTLRFEDASVFAYERVLAAGLLARDEARLAERLRAHEAEHADALARRLFQLAGRRPHPPAQPEQVEFPQVRVALDRLRDRADALALLVEVERLSHDVYEAAIAGLRDARHIQLAATILGAEASHLVAWRAVR